MSSVTDPQPDPAADEIVAYLDGELPPQDCRRVESRLATDEEYRQELHDLDRAWEALDVLPAPTVDDGFARTTIELACVAAEADLNENASNEKAANRNRVWRWLAAGVAASVFGFLLGRVLIPHRNAELLADLPSIHQFNVLPYVDNVEFLRILKDKVPRDQLIKDESALERNVKELEGANSPSFETRREWVRSLPPDRKAELADRNRAFNDLEPASKERDLMKKVMDDIRQDKDVDGLQATLVAYGQWLSRHSAGQQLQIREQLNDLSPEKQVAVVQRHIERDEAQPTRHLSEDDATKLRQEIVQLAKERRPNFDRPMGRKGDRGQPFDEQRTREAAGIAFKGLFLEKDNSKRAEVEDRLIRKLSPTAQAHWKNLGQSQRPFDKARQMSIWVRDAMDMRVTQEELENFFASEDKLSPDRRQLLLDEPRAKMESDLKTMYFNSKLGIENSGQMFGEFGGPERMPWGGPGMGPPPEGGPNRPPGFGPERGSRPEGPPGDRRQRKRPPGPPGERPPQDQKQEAI